MDSTDAEIKSISEFVAGLKLSQFFYKYCIEMYLNIGEWKA